MAQTDESGKKPSRAVVKPIYRITFFVFLIFLVISNCASAAMVQAYIGETIPLSGYMYSSQTAYLFLTGPNLPANGVALDNINNRADQGGFTEVSVDGNNHWTYNWYTGSIGGKLDAGTYTIWVVDGPNDLSNLNQADYSTISVSLNVPGLGPATASTSPGSPVITAAVPASIVSPLEAPGILEINSIPDNASIVVNGVYQGITPLTLNGLNPGTYQINFSRFNYYPFSTNAPVEPGVTTQVNGTLKLMTGTLVITTNPEGAQILLDGMNVNQSPIIQTGLSVGNHTINATLEGYIPANIQVNVVADQSVNSTLQLNKTASLIPGNGTPLPIPVTMSAFIVALIMFVFFRRCI
ncbi:MAG: PEGA domain-containing protein [Methanoregula sp.]